jgi:hypothetical protein
MDNQFVIEFRAKSDQAVAETQKLQRNLNAVAQEAKGLPKFFAGVLPTQLLTAAGAFAALQGVFRSATGMAQEIKRTAETFGIGASSVQVFSQAALAADASADDLFAALRRLNEAQSEALRGNDKLRATFARFGISAEDLVQLNLDQVLMRIGHAMAAAGGSAAQLVALTELLGGKAPKLARMLRELPQARGPALPDWAVAELAAQGDAAQQAGRTTKSWLAKWWIGISNLPAVFAPARASDKAAHDAARRRAANQERDAAASAARDASAQEAKAAAAAKDADELAKLRDIADAAQSKERFEALSPKRKRDVLLGARSWYERSYYNLGPRDQALADIAVADIDSQIRQLDAAKSKTRAPWRGYSADSLAAIGGFGIGADAAIRIADRQVRLLERIEANTRLAKSASLTED